MLKLHPSGLGKDMLAAQLGDTSFLQLLLKLTKESTGAKMSRRHHPILLCLKPLQQ